MKIGLVCPYNIFKGGGVQECVLAIQTELKRRGHDAKIITPLPRDKNGQEKTDVIFIGRAADIKSPFHTTAQISVSLDSEAIDEVLEREKFDILHFHEPWVPMVSMQILARSKSKNVATFHAKLPETVMSRTIEKVITPYTRSIMKYLDELTAVSDAAAEYVTSVTKKAVDIVPNGIDLSVYKRTSKKDSLKDPAQPESILFVGRLERRKGVLYLLKAFRLLAETKPDAQLLIAGDGPDREKLRDYVIQNRLSNVSFLGYVSHDEKIKLMSQASLFVSPALYGESFGIVLLEAMAAGVPLVAGNNPGYMSVLKETGELSIINPKDSNEFARRMAMLMDNAAIRKVWLEWAQDYVKQFSYGHVVDQYENIYNGLMK